MFGLAYSIMQVLLLIYDLMVFVFKELASSLLRLQNLLPWLILSLAKIFVFDKPFFHVYKTLFCPLYVLFCLFPGVKGQNSMVIDLKVKYEILYLLPSC